MITQHVRERLAQRVGSDTERHAIERTIESVLSACKRDEVRDAAVRVWRIVGKVHTADGSNGQCAVLIVRGGQGATVMWRRVTQAHTRAAYDVDRVMCVKGTCTRAEHEEHK